MIAEIELRSLVYPDGRGYDGEMSRGMRHSRSYYNNPNAYKSNGDCVKDKRNGFSTV
jgi:hypothetical protein